MDLKKTLLNETHKSLNAKMVDFGGWEMPVQYSSIIEEHNATREKAGLFDVSHMGEILLKGKNCLDHLNYLLTNDVKNLKPKKVIYSPIPNENGGIVDDLIVYMIDENEILLVVNASNTEKDFKWFTEKFAQIAKDEVEVLNVSSEYGQIAIQGPLAQSILQKVVDKNLDEISFFSFDYVKINGCEVIVSRTGYTGEDGFEIYCKSDDTVKMWNILLESGKEEGILPVGLGARDTLRFEAGLPLYGHELKDDITPIEANLKFFVKLNKDFIGKEVIEKQVNEGVSKKLVGIEIVEKGIPREGYIIKKGDTEIGYVASGTHSPTFKKGLASAFISTEFIEIGTEVSVIIREKPVLAKIVKMPFYSKKTKNK